ncbi:MAG: HAMP domain-containing histidine kinase [Sedimentisphaerales bacterium]|nr:HAMP domain-containing histidine kinase [Sedimentisphaerales bacterium]
MESILQRRKSLQKDLSDRKSQIIKLRAQSAQAQALANLGLISSMIAHEMNNILTHLGTYAELAINNPDDTQLARKVMKKTAANSARASNILKSMLAMANGEKQEKKYYNLKDLIDEIFTCIARDPGKDKINLNINIPENMTVYCEGICLQQVLMNLILNGREAMLKRGGTLSIRAQKLDRHVQIEVSDTGCGIEKENLSKIFEPFYTTKDEKDITKRNGAGLGLAFCKKVIDAHNGTISVESKPARETNFRIKLPDDVR